MFDFKFLISIVVLFSAFSAVAHADRNCDSRLRAGMVVEAAKDFPGMPVDIVFQPTREGLWSMACIEVRRAVAPGEQGPGEILGVYTTEVDEVCELNNGYNRAAELASCSFK